MKIVFCTNAICYAGGMERVTIAKANALAAIEGNEVWIAVTDNNFQPALPLDPKVHLKDLEIDYFENESSIFAPIARYLKGKKHRSKLQSFLNEIKPDICISVGWSEKYFLPHLKVSSKPKFIRETHYIKHYRINSATSFISKMKAKYVEWYDYSWKIKAYDKIVVETQEDRDTSWDANDDKVMAIHNPIISKPSAISDQTNKIVMACGRLAAVKNFSSLLDAWKIVEQKNPDWELRIWGDGVLKNNLQNKIDTLQLKTAHLMGYSADVINKYSEASILALTSDFEGFSLAIVEAFAAGVPVASYSCPCGPKELVTNGVEGFLVNPGDHVALAERINYMIEHEDERKEMAKHAYEKSKGFELDAIASEWMALFRKLRSK